jgi:hypothetical protein
MMKLITALENGLPQFVTLNNGAVVKITKITIDDGEQDALYEILSTIPEAPYLALKDQQFIYKNFLNFPELSEFLNEYQVQTVEESQM